ncbi:hypothetical protein ORJ04_22210 [Rheinheimera baltica]|uniref:Uncharacterized protein n=1 Tax=Rheinheimera baltica TaxID=67576 RepID=A0ABT9I5K6_9GAMM|nr:hypothetical protein [Rheinheimera baltica]MDP5138665.1 hypothetical protein [Rheinheimera baltica]MDP5150706.1 hypothetical protein [Rheinheimera baltica]
MEYRFYPPYNQHCGRQTQALIIAIFMLISLLPLFFDYGRVPQLKFMLLVFSPGLAYCVVVAFDYLASRYLMPGSVKPFKITESQLFIPKWLIHSEDSQLAQDTIIDVKDLLRIVINSYTLRSKRGEFDAIDTICLQFYHQRIYLDSKKLMFESVITDKNKLIKALKSLPCDTAYENKNNFGDVRLLHTVAQGRWGSTYTLLIILMFILMFGSFLRLIFW